MTRLGLFGGSFDPVHRGHLALARAARDQLQLDRVLFVPAWVSPHKLHALPAAPHHRLRMLELALEEESRLWIEPFELKRGMPTATVDTVTSLAAEHRDWEITFVVGQDAFASLARWSRPELLVRCCDFAVYRRPDAPPIDLEARLFADARVHWLTGPTWEVSATDLRRRIAAEQPTPALLPVVRAYIDRERLYRDSV